jgi:hypothetical protein
MSDEELVSLAVMFIKSSKIAPRWDSVGDYPKASELRELMKATDAAGLGVIDFTVRVLNRYCPTPATPFVVVKPNSKTKEARRVEQGMLDRFTELVRANGAEVTRLKDK